MIAPRPHIAKMAPYALADFGGEDWVSLAQNESAFGPSPAAVSAGRAALEHMPLYPDPDWTVLRAAIAQTHDLNPARILCGAGSMELIGCLIRAFAGPGDRILGTEYGYAFVATAAAQVEADYVAAREIDLAVSVDDILDACQPDTRIVFLCNPGNPAGGLEDCFTVYRAGCLWLDALGDCRSQPGDGVASQGTFAKTNPGTDSWRTGR